MYVYCVYPAMSKKSENLSDLTKKDRNKRHSSPFINVVKGVFFVVRVTLVPVSYLSAPPAVHSYRVPGKFIRLVRIKQKFTNKAKIYSYSIFVQQMYWLQDKCLYSYLVMFIFVPADVYIPETLRVHYIRYLRFYYLLAACIVYISVFNLRLLMTTYIIIKLFLLKFIVYNEMSLLIYLFSRFFWYAYKRWHISSRQTCQ
jgi:hypothetical protein